MAKSAKPAKKKGGAKKIAPGRRKAAGATAIGVKRAYDPREASDGLRVLIDRLWPRGIAKARLKLDAWVKHVAPSNGLRKWYRHDPEKRAEFRKRYRAELAAQPEGLAELRSVVKGRRVTLLTATRDLDLSHARMLRELLA